MTSITTSCGNVRQGVLLFLCLTLGWGCASPAETASSTGPTETETSQWEQQPIPNSEADTIDGAEEEVNPGVTIQFGEEEDVSSSTIIEVPT